MNTQIVTHVFAAIQTLERSAQTSRSMLTKEHTQYEEISQKLEEQEGIILKMRREANKLQLQVAKESWQEVTRSLNIVYGLNQMVRPEVLATLQTLAYGVPKEPKLKSLRPLYH